MYMYINIHYTYVYIYTIYTAISEALPETAMMGNASPPLPPSPPPPPSSSSAMKIFNEYRSSTGVGEVDLY